MILFFDFYELIRLLVLQLNTSKLPKTKSIYNKYLTEIQCRLL